MTAGIYAGRHKLKTLLITKDFGGQMAKKAVSIENYPGFEEISGLELIQKFEKHLRGQKIEIKNIAVRKIEKKSNVFSVKTSDKKEEYQARSVIIASGADPRPLEVPGEKEFIGKGVSYCVTCDGPFYSGKDVAVIGGGNAGIETAIALGTYAKKIYILEFSDNLKADKNNQDKISSIKNVKVITGSAVTKIEGGNFVESISYQDKKTKEEKKLKVQGVFVEIGYQPATSFVKGLVDFNEKDEIMADPKTNETKTPGLFVAGDVGNVFYKQIVIACGEGAKAALSVHNYLQKNVSH